jgi:hypothetical protein
MSTKNSSRLHLPTLQKDASACIERQGRKTVNPWSPEICQHIFIITTKWRRIPAESPLSLPLHPFCEPADQFRRIE